MNERDRYSIVVTNDPIRNCLVVEFAVGEKMVLKFFQEGDEIKLAVYGKGDKPDIITNANLFLEACQDAFKDVLTLPK